MQKIATKNGGGFAQPLFKVQIAGLNKVRATQIKPLK
jgi:hypothetical protein